MLTVLDADALSRNLSRDDGELMKSELLKKFKPRTVLTTFQHVCTLFSWGVKCGFLDENPFKGIRRPVPIRTEKAYVSMDMYRAILDACPTQEWRVLVALCRIGGLRYPSEVRLLTWGDITWDKGRGTVLVHSPKTDCHPGKGSRLVPLWPILRTELEALYVQAVRKGKQRIITLFDDLDDKSFRLKVEGVLCDVIRKAGLKPWRMMFNTMRANASTDIANDPKFGPLCESIWLGHSHEVAEKHYLQITPEQNEWAVTHGVAAAQISQ